MTTSGTGDHSVRAMNVLDGTVIGRQHAAPSPSGIHPLECRRARDSSRKTVHAILDNYAAHKHPAVRNGWRFHPRWTFHFTPTSASLAQRCRGLLRHPNEAASQARSFSDLVVDLQAAINRFLEDHNAQSKPFEWVADPDKIIAAVRRGHQMLDSIH